MFTFYTWVYFMVASLLIICSPIHLSTPSFNLKMLKSERCNTFEANYVTSHPLFHMWYTHCVKSVLLFKYQDNLRLSILCGISHVANVTSLPPKCVLPLIFGRLCVRHNETFQTYLATELNLFRHLLCVFVLFFSLRFFSCFSELTKFIFYEFGWFVLRSSEKL